MTERDLEVGEKMLVGDIIFSRRNAEDITIDQPLLDSWKNLGWSDIVEEGDYPVRRIENED